MSAMIESLLEDGISRYQSGEAPEELVPVFKRICDRSPKHSASWTCLAWLYLLTDQAEKGYKAAQKAVKLNGQDPQARINLAIAAIESGHKGVRQHIEKAQELIATAEELRDEVKKNLEEGLSRKPDWRSLKKVSNWLFGE